MNKFVITLKNDGVFDIKTKMNSSDIMNKLTKSEEWVELEGNILRVENIEAIFENND